MEVDDVVSVEGYDVQPMSSDVKALRNGLKKLRIWSKLHILLDITSDQNAILGLVSETHLVSS